VKGNKRPARARSSRIRLHLVATAVLTLTLGGGCGGDDDSSSEPPVIESLRDENGDGVAVIGEDITLVGTSGNNLRVTVAGVDAPLVEGNEEVVVRVPPGVPAGLVPVVAENRGGTSAPVLLQVRRLAFTADFADHALSVLDVDGLQVTPIGMIEVDVPPGPFAVAFTPDGRTAVVACGVGFLPSDVVALLAPNSPPGDSVAIVDVIAGETVAVVRIGEDSIPTGVAIHPDGQTAYVSNYASNTISVIDLAERRLIANVAVPRQPEEIAVRSDGAVLLVNSVGGTVTLVDTESLEILATLATGGNDPSGVAWAADGTTGYVTNSFTNPTAGDDGTLTVLNLADPATPSVTATITESIGPTPFDVDIVPGSGVALVTNLSVVFEPLSVALGSISLVDFSTTPPQVEVLPVGLAPIRAAVSSDGLVALVGNGLAQTVSVVDLEGRTIADTVDLESTVGPSDVAIQP
jgi:YVTN family beta-propeller protein